LSSQSSFSKQYHSHKSRAQWSRSVGTHFLQRWLQLWKLRNTSRHGEDPVAKSIALQAQVLCELTQLYSLRLDVLPWDQALFYPTVEAHIAAHKSTSVIQNWRSTHRTLIVLSAKEAACLTLQGFCSLTTYYPPAPSQKPPATPLVPPGKGCLQHLLGDCNPHRMCPTNVGPFRLTIIPAPFWCREARVYSSLWSEIELNK
jgi:hypothetical protein